MKEQAMKLEQRVTRRIYVTLAIGWLIVLAFFVDMIVTGDGGASFAAGLWLGIVAAMTAVEVQDR